MIRPALLLAGAAGLIQVPCAAVAQDAAAVKPARPAAKGASRRLAPQGSPQSWVVEDDYPALAVREHEEGVVGFRLDVGPDGRAVACTVISSSGYSLLDESACSVLQRRARFYPALDAGGKPVPAPFTSRFRWTLSDDTGPWESWARVARIELSGGGLSSCKVEEFGTPKALRSNLCGYLAEYTRDAIPPEAGTRLIAVERHEAIGKPFPAGVPAPEGQFHLDKITYDILPDGKVSNCVNVHGEGAGFQSGGYRCHPGILYPAVPEGVVRRGSASFLLFPASQSRVAPAPPGKAAAP